uniref:Uncharacterized protein n=1 Tax=Arundo donax TaxID=35708 RepID=A0A0A9AKL2_ARUDO
MSTVWTVFGSKLYSGAFTSKLFF